MWIKIRFEEHVNEAVFRYENLVHYFTALLLSLPITICYFYLVAVIFMSGIGNLIDLLIILVIIAFYILLVIVTNAVQAPLINPQWIFTSVKKLKIDNQHNMSLQYGFFPLCLHRRFVKEEIDDLRLVMQKRGRGLGIFLYFLSQANLYSLIMVLNNGKTYYLAENETRNGTLAEEGLKLAEYLNISFDDKSRLETNWFLKKTEAYFEKKTYRAIRFYVMIPPLLVLMAWVINTGAILSVWITIGYIIFGAVADYLIRGLVKFEER